MEYLNHLSSSENKLSSISKGMKAQFFSNMSDIALNKHDELKFLILMREELFKYKFKTFCFNKWKVRTLYNRDLIEDENPFYSRKFNYDHFKKHSSLSKEANNSNFSGNRNGFKNRNDIKFFDSLNSNNKNNSNRIFDSLNSHNYAYSGGGESERWNQLGVNFIKNPNQQSSSIDKSNGLDKLLNNDELLRRNEDNENNINNMNNNNEEDKKANNNDIMDFNYLLMSNKKSIDSIQDSMNVLNVQKNINEALNNTNNLLTKLSSQKKEIVMSDININEENGNKNIVEEDDKFSNNKQKDDNFDKRIIFYDSLNYNDNIGDNNNLKKNKMNFKYIGKRENSNNKQYLNEDKNKIINELDYANEKGEDISNSNSNINSNVNEIANDDNQIQNNYKSYSIKNIINKYKNLENINNENDIDNFIKNYNKDQNDYQDSLEKLNNNNNNKLDEIINYNRNDDVGNDKYFEDINNWNANQKDVNDNNKYKSQFLRNNLYYQNVIKNKNFIYNLIENKKASINNADNNQNKENNNYNINLNKDNNNKLFTINNNLENLKNKSTDNNLDNKGKNAYEINQNNIRNENRANTKKNKLNNVKKNLFKKIDNKINSKKNDRNNNQRNLLYNNYKFNNKYNNRANLDSKNLSNNFNHRTLLMKNNKNNLGKSYDNKTMNSNKILSHNNSKNNSKNKKIFENKNEMNNKSNNKKTILSKYNYLLKIDNNKNSQNINKIPNQGNNIKNKKHNYRQNISENKLDLKKLFKFPIKYDENENEKYNNKTSKYISVKYKNYLNSNTGDSLNKSLKNKYSYFIPKKNSLYDYLINNSNQKNMEIALNTDKVILNKLKKNKIEPKNKLFINNELFETNAVPNRAKTICNIKKNYSKINNINSLNEAGDLLNNGFFSPNNNNIKNKYNFDNENTHNINNDNNNYEESNYDLDNTKIKKLLKKYKSINYNNNLKEYDYIKKFKGDDANIFAINTVQNDNYYQTKNNDDTHINENDYDEIFQHDKNSNIDNINTTEYNEIFYKKNKLMKNSPYDILSDSRYNTYDEYAKSANNILANTRNVINYDNYYNYDDLVNNLSQLSKDIKIKYNSNTSKSNLNKNKLRIVPDSTIDNFQSQSYMLSPMNRAPITNISFRARMRYFSNKKEKNLERMMKKKVEEDSKRYTFQPKTCYNKLNVIKYNNYGGNNLNTYKDKENNAKRKVDTRRINNLYLNYKDKEDKIDQLTRKYYKDAGISFSPTIIDRNKEIIKFKKKIGQIPYIDRMEVYDIKRKLKNDEEQIKYYNTIIQQ